MMPSLSLQVVFVQGLGVCPTGRFHAARWLGSERFNSWDFEVTGTLSASGLPELPGCPGVQGRWHAEPQQSSWAHVGSLVQWDSCVTRDASDLAQDGCCWVIPILLIFSAGVVF